VFGKLQGRSAVANREVGLSEGSFRAAKKLSLQRALFHVVDQKERTRANLHIRLLSVVTEATAAPIVAVVLVCIREPQGRADEGNQHEGGDVSAHHDSSDSSEANWSQSAL